MPEGKYLRRRRVSLTSRRTSKLGMGSQAAVLALLMERDKGICAICTLPVTETEGPMRPSIDHITPLSKGGTHDPSNVQLSHYRCNLRRGNRL